MTRPKYPLPDFLKLFLLYAMGTALGLWLWPMIALPFSNPLGVIGPYTKMEINPSTEVVRFLVVLLLPILFLTAFYVVKYSRKGKFQPVMQRDQSGRLSRVHLLFTLLFMLVFALNIGIEKYLFDYFHDGESLGPAINFLSGDVPYKDYLFLHGFFQDPLRSVWAFSLFGKSISSLEIMDTVLKMSNCLLLGFLLYRLFRKYRMALWLTLPVLVVLGVANRLWTNALYDFVAVINLQARDSCTFVFLIVITYLHEALNREKQPRKELFVLGALLLFSAFFTYLYSVDRAYYLSAAALVLGVLIPVFSLKGKIRWHFLAGSIVGAGLALLCFGWVIGDGVPYFLEYYFKWLPQFKELVDGIPYEIGEWPFLIMVLMIAFNAFWIAEKGLICVLGEGWSGVSTFIKRYLMELTLGILMIFFFRSALGRSDYYHLAYISIIPYLLFFLILFRNVENWLSRKEAWVQKTERLLLVGCMLIAVLGFVRLFTNDAYLLKANFPFGVEDQRYLGDDYLETIQFLKENMDETDQFFTLTNELCWYYFLDAPCPTRYHLTNFASPTFMQEEMVEELKSASVKFVLYNNEDPFNHFDDVGFRERTPLLTDYIHETFRPFRTFGQQEIWIRKDQFSE